MSNNKMLKSVIAHHHIKEHINRVTDVYINENDGTVSYNIKRANAKSHTESLLTLLTIKDSVLATSMLCEGYCLVPINSSDYVVISPKGKQYQISNTECTCPDFVVGRSQGSRCKHLIFRDWHLQYQQQCMKLKEQL